MEYTFLQINALAALWCLVGMLTARFLIWNKEIKAYNTEIAKED